MAGEKDYGDLLESVSKKRTEGRNEEKIIGVQRDRIVKVTQKLQIIFPVLSEETGTTKQIRNKRI